MKNITSYLFIFFTAYLLIGISFDFYLQWNYLSAHMLQYSVTILALLPFYYLGRLNLNFARGDTGFTFKGDNLAIILSVLSIICYIIDRVYFREVNFFEDSMVEIRKDLSKQGMLLGVSSIYSLFANLFQLACLYTFIKIIIFYEEYSVTRVSLVLLSVLLIILVESYILGGRSLILITFTTGLGAFLYRRLLNKPLFPNTKFRNLVLITGLLFMIFVVFVFVMRGLESIMLNPETYANSQDYLNNKLNRMNPDELNKYTMVGVNPTNPFHDIWNYILFVFAYVYHQVWVLHDMMIGSKDTSPGILLFNSVINVFGTKLGFNGVPTNYDTLLASVFGGLFYNLKYWSLIVYVLASAVFAYIIFYISKIKNSNMLGVYFIIIGFATVIASPVIFLFNTPYTYYLVFDIVVISIINQLRIKSQL